MFPAGNVTVMSSFITTADGRISAFETRYDYDAAYLRALLRASPDGFRAFEAFGAMAEYRSALSADAYYVARLAALQTEDCGACARLAARMGREGGASEAVLRAAFERDAGLPDELKRIYDFASGVAANQVDPALREAVRRDVGEEGLAELALCAAAARVYPCLKRGLGFASASCERVSMDWKAA